MQRSTRFLLITCHMYKKLTDEFSALTHHLPYEHETGILNPATRVAAVRIRAVVAVYRYTPGITSLQVPWAPLAPVCSTTLPPHRWQVAVGQASRTWWWQKDTCTTRTFVLVQCHAMSGLESSQMEICAQWPLTLYNDNRCVKIMGWRNLGAIQI